MDGRIAAESKSIKSIFGVTRKVPAYQREYSWQRAGEVKALWEDLMQHLDENGEDDYLLGPIVVTRGQVPEIIDGQQRLITLFLLQAAFRYRLLELGGDSNFINEIGKSLIEYDEDTATLNPRIRHHDPLANEVLVEIGTMQPNDPGNPRSMKGKNASISHRRIVHAFVYLMHAVDSLGPEKERVDDVIRDLRRYVQLIEIETTDVTQAIYVFERANFRGKPLDPSDLLKNLIFQGHAGDFDLLAQEWRKIQNSVDSTRGVQVMDFLRWYHLGIQDGFYATSRSFTSLVEPYARGQNPLEYVRSMISRSSQLRLMANDHRLSESGPFSENLAGISVMSGGRQRAHWPLLLATAEWSVRARESLAFELERLMFYSLVTGIKSQNVERSIRTITILARDNGETSLERVVSELATLAARYRRDEFFDEKFLRLSLEDEEHLVRYALKKIHDGLYREFNGKSRVGANAASADFESAEVEHIWPRADADAIATEENPALVHCIGNLLLLSRQINASGGRNAALTKLTQTYSQEETKYLIAKNLFNPLPTSGNHGHAKAIALCPTGFDEWNQESISRLSREYLSLFDLFVPPPSIDGSQNSAVE